jgi:hypothetical protein
LRDGILLLARSLSTLKKALQKENVTTKGELKRIKVAVIE